MNHHLTPHLRIASAVTQLTPPSNQNFSAKLRRFLKKMVTEKGNRVPATSSLTIFESSYCVESWHRSRLTGTKDAKKTAKIHLTTGKS